MRFRPVFFAVLLAAGAWSAQAQTAGDETRDRYQGELQRQCPDRQLQLLSPRQLRDGLDAYMGGLSQDTRDTLQKAETDQCSSMDDGVACVNNADIAAADQIGRLPDLAGSICANFIRCRSDGDCDYAR